MDLPLLICILLIIMMPIEGVAIHSLQSAAERWAYRKDQND